jgi:short subunit dehydrogenase-like uncharacterized protein
MTITLTIALRVILTADPTSALILTSTLTLILGGASGGTIASVINIFASLTMKTILEVGNPYLLNPRDSVSGNPLQASDKSVSSVNKDTLGFFYDKIEGNWMSPWIMQGIDTRIVHRSNALTNFSYGQNLIYRELQKSPNMMVAAAASVLGALVAPLLFFSLTRNFINYFLPKQGEGPTEYERENGFFKVAFWGRGQQSGKEVIIRGGVKALKGDPGYKQTAKFAAEAGVCLAMDQNLPPMYGILTPSTAMGTVLIDRLKNKGVEFYMGEDPNPNAK